MSKEGLRVLVLSDSRAFHTERFVRELRRQGCQVLPVSIERGRLHHYHLRARGTFRSLHYVLAVPELKNIIKKFQPDVINPHFASGYGFISALSNRKRRIPVFLNLWGSDILIVPHKSNLHRRKTAYALARADFISADSKYILEAAAKIATLGKSKIIPWGLEGAYLDLHVDNRQFQSPAKIIVPRHHERIYNNLFIVRALAPLVNAGKIEITFPSFGSLAEHFRKNAETLVGDRVKFYDKLPRPEFMQFMSQHDVYLSSALSDSSPVSLIESMGLGLIPVAADIPGVREWLAPGSGYLYQSYNAGELRKLIEQLLDRKDEEHVRMRAVNFERVRSEARFERNVADSIAIMRSLVKRKKK
jgi:glycosyltransferase involved in cell wall biosynthesis